MKKLRMPQKFQINQTLLVNCWQGIFMPESGISAYKTSFLYADYSSLCAEKEKNSMQIQCDKCSTVSETVMPETYLEGDIEFTFFRCPSCGEIYPVCVTDSALRADIAEYSRMRNVIRVKPVTESFIRKAEDLKQRNLKRTRELMAEHPLAPFLME
jgi:hypothetical protein